MNELDAIAENELALLACGAIVLGLLVMVIIIVGWRVWDWFQARMGRR